MKLAVSAKVDDANPAKVVRPEIGLFEGESADIVVKPAAKDSGHKWQFPARAAAVVGLPPGVNEEACYLHSPTGWVPVKCVNHKEGTVTTLAFQARSDAELPALEGAVEKAKILVAKVVDKASGAGGAWRVFQIVREKETPPEAHSELCPDTTPAFPGECVLAAQKILGPVPAAPTTVLEQSATPPVHGPIYAVCIDFLDKGNPALTAYDITNGVKADAKEPDWTGARSVADLRFDTRRAFHVFVRRPQDDQVEVIFAGTTGMASQTLDKAELTGAGTRTIPGKEGCTPGPVPKVSRFPQLAQLTGTIDLTVKLNKVDSDGKKTELASRSWKLAVDNHVSFVVRLGLGMLWQPYARKVEQVTTLGGVQYTQVTAGDGSPPGLYSAEFLIGATWFPWEISETEVKPHFGIGGYLGLLALKDNGLDALNCLVVGPELAIGPDFSIGLLAGIHRNEVPKRGFEPGQVIPAGKTYDKNGKELNVGPTFGLILNFTPTMFKSIFKTGG